jgi:hypothetical protein
VFRYVGQGLCMREASRHGASENFSPLPNHTPFSIAQPPSLARKNFLDTKSPIHYYQRIVTLPYFNAHNYTKPARYSKRTTNATDRTHPETQAPIPKPKTHLRLMPHGKTKKWGKRQHTPARYATICLALPCARFDQHQSLNPR